MDKLKPLPYYVFIGLLAYMPLHVFLATWLGSSFGYLDQAKVLKDIVMIFGFFGLLLVSPKKIILDALKTRIVVLIGLYALLTILLAVFRPTDQNAETLGVVYNLRFLLFFIYALIVYRNYGKSAIVMSVKTVLVVSTVVILFGIMQVTILPKNLLTHFGYSYQNGTIPAYFISDKHDYQRAMATIKDPNSLGAYLIIIASLGAAIVSVKSKRKVLGSFLLGFAMLCLIATLSRSAWIGFIASLGVLALVLEKPRKWLESNKKTVVVAATVCVCLIGIVLSANWQSSFIQNTILHVGQKSPESSNSLRIKVLDETFLRVRKNPVGFGPGTAGPTSMKNKLQGPFLPENYYLGLVIEVGVVGMIIFIAIIAIIVQKLYKLSKNNWIAGVLLASLVGLSIANIFLPIWSNEAVAYTWWGLTGLVYLIRQVKNA